MRFAAVSNVLPSRRVTNDEMVTLFRDSNQTRFPASVLEELEHRTRTYLDAAGTSVRYCLAKNEKPIDFAVRAVHRALERANIAPGDVDFLIYASVARGWIEPSTAAAVQAAAGLTRASSFDVGDACAGWIRALDIGQSFLLTGRYGCGLIVNAECGLYRSYLRTELSTPEELEWRLAAFTIGEAATATVITAEHPDAIAYIRFRSLPEHHRLCMIPLPNIDDFLTCPIEPPPVPLRLFTDSRELLRTAARAIVEEFRGDRQLSNGRYDIAFGHSPSEKAELLIADRLGLGALYTPMHRRFGNTGSASVPLAISVALDEGRLTRGQRAIAVVGASGITVGFATFTF